jgi:hypothetical protein
MDVVAASVATIGSFGSNQTSVTWGTSTPSWTGMDIGSPPIAGSDTLSNGVWTISGSGRDIGGTADQFHLVFQPLAADGGVAARVLTQTNTNSRARAGVMLRGSPDAGAPFYALLVTPGAGLFVLQRPWANANVVTISNIPGTVPAYVSVLRSGSIVTAYTSSDGVSWTPIAGSSEVLGVSGTVLAGMAVTSHSTSALSTATFGSVGLPTSAPPPPNNFSIPTKPSSLNVVTGASVQTTIGTALISGSPEAIALSASGLPSGVTASFNPASVTTGGSSTLTISAGASVRAATYSFTVTGTSPSATHSVTVKLTVTAGSPPSNDFSMSASPGSVSVVQGAAGTSSIGTALVSGSAESIALSISGLPAGVTAAFNPTSVTTGGSSTLTLSVGATAPPGTYPLTVTGTAPSAIHTASLSLTVTSASGSGLPSPWSDTDVGAVGVAGSASYAGGVFTVNGSGTDIYGTSDQFNYVYQPVSGNGTLIARVASQTNTGSSNSKAGLIWKASTTSGSPYFLIAVNSSGVVKVQWNFNTSVQAATTYAFPNVWMKMVRSGSTFTAFLSPDGVAWTQVASATLSTIPTAATLGLAECSHVNTKLGTATFDNVSFTPGP